MCGEGAKRGRKDTPAVRLGRGGRVQVTRCAAEKRLTIQPCANNCRVSSRDSIVFKLRVLARNTYS